MRQLSFETVYRLELIKILLGSIDGTVNPQQVSREIHKKYNGYIDINGFASACERLGKELGFKPE